MSSLSDAAPERRLPDSADVVIVGSGPAGAAYARILSETSPAARIVMIEVGPIVSDPPGSHVKNIADNAERARAQRASEGPRPQDDAASTNTMDDYASDAARLWRPGTYLLASGYRQPGEDGLPAAAFSSNVGGMAAHWTGACPRPGQSERIGFLPDLDELLDEGERLLGVSATALADAPLADEVQVRLARGFDADRPADRHVQPMPLAVHRTAEGNLVWSGADVVFGEETRANPLFTLVPEALGRRVIVEDGVVRGIDVEDRRSGEIHRLSSPVVVVAADSLRTPQLLFASGVTPPALGRYLNDQPQIVHAVRLRDVEDAPTGSAADSAITAQSGVSWVPFTDDYPYHGQVMQLDASPVPLEGDVIPGSIVGLGWFCAKDLQESDRVEFSPDDVDEYGMPAMRIHYTLTERDHRTLADAAEAIIAAGELLGDPVGGDPITFPPGASLHYQGTVRMGAVDDGTSVCDPHGEVWGTQGLFVAGNGVIPTATACNPTLTGVALAVAGARRIARTLDALTSK
ncbi:GMC oxidoreductase [Microbacterium sp. Bi128]|uniref:GMC oxidoreductase n=1 Tax=Microbacterium sp. Bi128 TaxID=2821115 RepID=UPI001D8C449E|nr:GMC oxidoreductase [Microbacterium sp. Bi128]CAH0210946.1 6'''-hydroxyparomomycin C oxidase [Microbacterium sp. Bi128]